jgi:phosphate transport system substrate-binding protein
MRHSHHRWTAARTFANPVFAALLTICCFAAALQTQAQNVTALAAVKKVYVDAFSEANTAQLRDRLIERLNRSGKLAVVPDPASADAVVKGSGSVWITGYTSNTPKAPANTRQPIYRGYLSVELQGKNHEPLWSYLVTPSRLRADDISKDLADHLVARLVADIEKSANSPSSATTAAAGSSDAKAVTLTAAGATFPAPLYQRWFELFSEQRPNLQVRYTAVGSEAGIDMLLNGKADFAASDFPLSDERLASAKTKITHLASVIGAVVPVYNVKGPQRPLNFTPEVLAGIYLGKIRRWNDPAIRAVNHGAQLPDAEIAVVHRSDGSGTTYVWTDYLSKVSPDWKSSIGAGSHVTWPVGTGAEGNDGVASAVQATPNSIGYVELVYALRHQLNFGAVRNASGEFVAADLTSVTAAGAGAAAAMEKDPRISITNAPGKGAYPIASFTWWLLPVNTDPAKTAAIRDLASWMLSSGQKQCSALGYVPLPKEVADRELKLVEGMK